MASLYRIPGSELKRSTLACFDNGPSESTVVTTCYDEGPFISGQLYEEVRTDVGTDRGVKESLLISEDSMLPPHFKVAPSILLTEVEGPPS